MHRRLDYSNDGDFPASEESQARRCLKCGRRLAPNAIFCVHCGTDQTTGRMLKTTIVAPRHSVLLKYFVAWLAVAFILGLIPLCGWFLLLKQDRQAHARAMVSEPRNVLADKGKSFFLQSGIRISFTRGGRPLPTLGETATCVAPWIKNDLDNPDIVVIPGTWANTNLYFSGLVAAGKDLVRAVASIHAPTPEADERETQVVEFLRDANASKAGGAVPAPFRFNSSARRYEVLLEGAFVVGQTFAAGSNLFTCTAMGTQEEDTVSINPMIVIVQGAQEVQSSNTAVLYCPHGPKVALPSLAPAVQRIVPLNNGHMETALLVEGKSTNQIVQSQVVVNGVYHSACGIKMVRAMLDGGNWPVDESESRLDHETYQIRLAGKPSQGAHRLNFVLEDLAGNVATSKTVSFCFLPAAVILRSSVQQVETNLFLSLEITGVGGPGEMPCVQSLAVNGRAIPVADLRYAGASAMLTNMPVAGRNGRNFYMLEAHVSLSTANKVELSCSSTVDYYVNRLRPEDLPDLPIVCDVHPEDEMLYGANGTYTFDAGHTFWATYYDRDPGVDAANVQVLVRNATGAWQNVSDQFVCNETKAQLKPDGSFQLAAAHPQIKLLVPEKGCPTPSAFVKSYRLLDASRRKAPYIQNVRPFLLVRGQTKDIRLEGRNLDGVHEVEFRGEANYRYALSPMVVFQSKYEASEQNRGETVSKSAIEVRVNPPACGVAYLYLDRVKQAVAPMLVVDAIDEQMLDYLVRNLQDMNGDGRVDALDLDSDGDGVPDLSLLVHALIARRHEYASDASGSCLGTLGAWYLQTANTNDQRAILDVLWTAANTVNPQMTAYASAALLQVAEQTNVVSRNALSQKALSMLDDPRCVLTAKATALLMCVKLNEHRAVPSAKSMLASARYIPLRLVAVTALEALGNESDRARCHAYTNCASDWLSCFGQHDDLSMASVALSVLASQTNSIVRTDLKQRAMSVLVDPNCGDALKVAALHVCMGLHDRNALPVIRNIAESNAPDPLRVTAVTAIGQFHDSLDYYLLDRLAHDYHSNALLRMAAGSALNQLNR